MNNSGYISGLVSVITPTYKRSEKLPRAIESILAQTYNQIELFVVNDNDPNDEFTQYVKTITKKYKSDPRFHLIIQERHVNGAVARNVAIKQAHGEYIAFLDDDDWWEINKLEEQVKALRRLDDTWGGVSCKFRLFNENGKVVGQTRKYKGGYIYKDILSLYSDVATGTLLLKHSALDETGYFDENLLRNQDIQLLAQFTYKYKLEEVDLFLHCVDVSDNQNRAVSEERLLIIRKALYESLDSIMSSLSNSEYRCIDSMRDLELGYVLFSQNQYKRAFKYFFSIFRSPSATLLAVKKLYRMLLLKRVKWGSVKKH